ncbi:ninja-family protein AFP3-like [Solanum dulcamara]|uniref:ninja-family protein AFP3-like n=1 Tax=Solanum dulcamara TaxID=45834 RepID=UPI0024854326|nr:ninja-family protein AFP3-like [Solanum dulcamara]
MEKAEEKGKEKLECFLSGGLISRKRNVEDENVDVELRLGLSLNGNYGFDPKKPKILNRSSSVTNVVHSGNRNENEFQFSLINRTSSLPMESEEEWRQRKELQFLSRLEAKKRLEKMKNVRVVKENGNSSYPSSEGSQGSVASSETGSETQQLPIQGPSGSSTNVRSVDSGLSMEGMQKLIAEDLETTNEKSPELSSGKNCKEMVMKNFMFNMPSVSARGEGPNGKKTEGFLYAYKKGENVKIVCVCHGNFLTPAEFVKHAGGGDVDNPLRHITINP